MTGKKTVAQGSSPDAQQAAGTPDEVERLRAELESRDEQIRGLSRERDSFKQRAQVWDQYGEQMGVQYDAYGNPTFPQQQQAPPQQTYNGSHPFSALIGDESAGTQLDQYYMDKFGQKFITADQLSQQIRAAEQRAYNAAKGDFMVIRTVDRTVSDPRYSDLSDYNSDLSKKTREILSRNQKGQALDGADSWDRWAYAEVNSLPMAAQIAKAELFEEFQAAQQREAEAAQNQQVAGLVHGESGLTPQSGQGASAEDMLDLLEKGDGSFDKAMEDQIRQNLNTS